MLINDFEKVEGFSDDGMYNIGIHYQYYLSETVSLKTGLDYRRNNIWIAAGYNPDSPKISESWDINLLSFSIYIYINYQPFKYLDTEGGPLLDVQFNIWDCQPTETQSGIGIGFDFGGI